MVSSSGLSGLLRSMGIEPPWEQESIARRQKGYPPFLYTLKINATMIQAAPVLGLRRISIRYNNFEETLQRIGESYI